MDNTGDTNDDAEDGPVTWATGGRKRRRQDKEAFKGLKLRKSESVGDASSPPPVAPTQKASVLPDALSKPSEKAAESQKMSAPAASPPAPKPVLGLVAYDSDDDD